MAGEIIFFGAAVERSSDGIVWTDVPGITEFTIPEQSTDRVEVTSLDNASAIRTYITGLTDLGDWTFRQNYTRAAMTQLEADKELPLQYRITLKSPDGGATTGDVILINPATRTGSPQINGLGEAVGISNTLTLGAVPTWTAGA